MLYYFDLVGVAVFAATGEGPSPVAGWPVPRWRPEIAPRLSAGSPARLDPARPLAMRGAAALTLAEQREPGEVRAVPLAGSAVLGAL